MPRSPVILPLLNATRPKIHLVSLSFKHLQKKKKKRKRRKKVPALYAHPEVYSQFHRTEILRKSLKFQTSEGSVFSNRS